MPVKIQSVLCEDDMFEENNRGLKIYVTKMCNNCLVTVILYAKMYKQKNNKQINCCCLSKIGDSGT